MHHLARGLAASLCLTAATTALAAAETETYTIITGGNVVGDMVVEKDGKTISVDYEYRNNGRGPTILEEITLGEDGLPVSWTVDGASTFGNKIAERFSLTGNMASWTDSTGTGEAEVTEPMIYVSQEASPYQLWVYANALLKDEDRVLPALPGGSARLTELETVTATGDAGPVEVTAWALTGTELDPSYFLLDDSDAFFGFITPNFIILREGYEDSSEELSQLASELAANRFADIQAKVAHDYDRPVRIENVYIFEPDTLSVDGPFDVVFEGNRITGVYNAETVAGEDEIIIAGNGGTLVPGLWDMHGHVSQDDALMNIAAGITSIRDMGNNNEVLTALIADIEAGKIASPRIVRSGFIEGKSPFNSNNGILVENQKEALDAVDWYADHGFWQIKIYNSMKGEWVPAMVERAHERGLRVAGHVPAFSNANQMIEAGYDEMTHINQIELGWVLEEGEDTRTLLRLTALKRLKDLDIDSAPVQHTLDLMEERGTAIDPTLAIHEALLLARNGEVQAGTVDYIDHMPVGVQRSAKTAWSDIANEADDIAYRAAWDRILETVSQMHERGIFIVFGTDLGGAFTLHREIELYQQAGFSAAGALRRATYDMADYMGQADDLGTVEKGKLADFFLVPGNPVDDLKAIKTISMVVADGTVYFPTEIYDEIGIEPFIDVPAIID